MRPVRCEAVIGILRDIATSGAPRFRRLGIVAAAAAFLFAGAASAADLRERLLQLNQREKQLIEKLEMLQQRERETQERLDEVRVLKQSIVAKLALQKPTSAEPTPTAAP